MGKKMDKKDYISARYKICTTEKKINFKRNTSPDCTRY